MTMAGEWQHLYNYQLHNPDKVRAEMAGHLISEALLVWEDTNVELFLFTDNSVLVIPEGDSAKAVHWERR